MEVCSICRDEVYPVNFKLPCGHMFHKHCIKQWLLRSKSCPICRIFILDSFICYYKRKPCFVKLNDINIFVKTYKTQPKNYYISYIKSINTVRKNIKLKLHFNNKNTILNFKCENNTIAEMFKKNLLSKKYNSQYTNIIAQNMHSRRALLD